MIDSPYATQEAIAARAYRAPGPATISVLTMVSNRSGMGAHSALVINGAQRVIFDPAGAFAHETVPERNDVLYGITPVVLKGYRSAHARSTYHVVTQRFVVSAEQADIALRLAEARGPVARSFCAMATSALLQQVPGFEDIRPSLFPTRLMDQLSSRDDVTTETHFEDDQGNVLDGVARVEP